MKRILIFMILVTNVFGFNFYDVSSVMNEVQQTLSDISYAKNTINYITEGVNFGSNKNMDYYRDPNNFKIQNDSNIHNVNKQVTTQIFNDSNPQRLADKVNNFIQNREIIDIQFSITSNIKEFYKQYGTYTTSDVDYMYSALIIYRR